MRRGYLIALGLVLVALLLAVALYYQPVKAQFPTPTPTTGAQCPTTPITSTVGMSPGWAIACAPCLPTPTPGYFDTFSTQQAFPSPTPLFIPTVTPTLAPTFTSPLCLSGGVGSCYEQDINYTSGTNTETFMYISGAGGSVDAEIACHFNWTGSASQRTARMSVYNGSVGQYLLYDSGFVNCGAYSTSGSCSRIYNASFTMLTKVRVYCALGTAQFSTRSTNFIEHFILTGFSPGEPTPVPQPTATPAPVYDCSVPQYGDGSPVVEVTMPVYETTSCIQIIPEATIDYTDGQTVGWDGIAMCVDWYTTPVVKVMGMQLPIMMIVVATVASFAYLSLVRS